MSAVRESTACLSSCQLKSLSAIHPVTLFCKSFSRWDIVLGISGSQTSSFTLLSTCLSFAVCRHNMFHPKSAVAGMGILTLLLWLGLGVLPFALADTPCSATLACETGCCGENLICGTGPDYCSADTCINNCDYKAECNPGDWDTQYYNSSTCPLNVCCSEYGFCGTTSEFCGSETVTRPSCDVDSQSITRVIGYYNSAAASRYCGGMTPFGFPQGVYSHIYFAFGTIDPDTFEVLPASANDEQLYTELASLQGRDLGQEMWLSIGGWTFSDAGEPTATTFSDLAAADITYQNVFFASLTLFMTTWGFTGVDIDWEYPAADDRNGRTEDYDNYPIFLKNLKASLDTYKFGLSITLPTSYWYLQHFDLVSIEPHVDWLNYMAYDLHGTWDIGSEWTGAYLNAHTNLTEITTSLDLLWRNNITSTKVNLGLAFYGRSFTVASSSCTEPGCAYLSAGDAGTCSATAGILMNSEIGDIISEYGLTPQLYEDAAVKVITWNDDQWVSYDDEDTWKLKGDFAKSQCLGGVLVWAVDQDDTNLTSSDGLAAALGNALNVNTTTGVTLTLTGDAVTADSDSDTPSQDSYCRWTNCGETCPNGFTSIVRDDNKKQLMLDSTECPTGAGQTQTLCCPTSTDVPTCRWRGFNGGKCKGGCNDGEAEVGTVSSGCRSGYQSACCTVTSSTQPYSECAWTSDCYDADDETCPDGYPDFVVGSRDGWGGRPSCSNSNKKKNYCCTAGSTVPDAFQNCDWYGHETTFTNTAYCSDSCPSGAIRVAEQSINTIMGNSKKGHTTDCYLGNEAYCCKGATSTATVSPRATPTTYQDQTASDFDAYLTKFLAAPVCPGGVDAEYTTSTWDKKKRQCVQEEEDNNNTSSTSTLERRATDQSITLEFLIPLVSTWITSQYARSDLTEIWNERLAEYGYSDSAATYSEMETALYESTWSTQPIYSVDEFVADILCNIANSATEMSDLGAASSALCELPDAGGTWTKKRDLDDALQALQPLQPRRLTESAATGRSSNNLEPTIGQAITGILNGDLSLHYVRFLSNTRNEMLVEVAFWIGPTPGTAPAAATRTLYGDATHTAATDRWIVMHLHCPLDANTFQPGNTHGRFPGVEAISIYHGQTIVQAGSTYRVNYRYTASYAAGQYNVAPYTNYGTRTEVLSCATPRPRRWYIGSATGATSTDAFVQQLYRFGVWLQTQGTFSNANLAFLFPNIASVTGTPPNWLTAYNPQSGAFNTNWLPDGSNAPDLSQADP